MKFTSSQVTSHVRSGFKNLRCRIKILLTGYEMQALSFKNVWCVTNNTQEDIQVYCTWAVCFNV